MTIPLQKRMNRLYLPQATALGQVIDLDEEVLHYLSRVLRILDQTEMWIWNGQGSDFVGQVQYLTKKTAQIQLIQGPFDRTLNELKRPVYIMQGLPEGDKMDWVLEKCTELGAAGFIPVQAQRSVVKLKGERVIKRQAHWERVVQSAGCQSERGFAPSVQAVGDFGASIAQFKSNNPTAQVLLFHPTAEISLADWCLLPSQMQMVQAKSFQTEVQHSTPNSTYPILIGVGPEGGWTAEELSTAQTAGATLLRFSNRILRTETFGIACLSQLIARLNLEPA
jgi:16S rRNA (uracil1498-N3)-methyltransferase